LFGAQLLLSIFISSAYGVDPNSIVFSGTPVSIHASNFATRLSALLAQTAKTFFLHDFCPTLLATLSSYVPIPFLSKFIRETNYAHAQLKMETLALINEARNGVEGMITDPVRNAALLKTLVLANMHQDDDSKRLTDDELLSNVFVRQMPCHLKK
jgi:hypothetical protein